MQGKENVGYRGRDTNKISRESDKKETLEFNYTRPERVA